jgi:hypothetical protein
MRYAGLRPAIEEYFIGGASSADLLSMLPTYVNSFYAARYREMIAPRSVELIWQQGEYEWLNKATGVWGANTAAQIAMFRAALGLPNLHVTVIQLAKRYYPDYDLSHDTTFLEPIRAEQAALVASDPHASIVCLEDVHTGNFLHAVRADLVKWSKLLVADTLTRVAR